MNYTLRYATELDLPDMLRWRNASHVREVMIYQHYISEEEHAKWWHRISNDEKVKILIIERAGTPIAVLKFYDIVINESACWGFYLTDKIDNKADVLKDWTSVEEIAIIYAFENLSVNILKCETRQSNASVLLLHQRYMFKEIEKNILEHDPSDWLVVKSLQKKEYGLLKERKLQQQFFATAMQLKSKIETKRFLFIGLANWEEIASDLKAYLVQYSTWNIEVYTTPFGQGMLELLDTQKREFYRKYDHIIFCNRLEDFVGPAISLSGAEAAKIDKMFDEYISQIEILRDIFTAKFIVHDFKLIRPRILSITEMVDADEPLFRLVTKMNNELMELAHRMNDTYIFPVSEIINNIGRKAADPTKYWLLARFPFGPSFNIAYNQMFLGFLLSLYELTARVVVLDLDNTCWGGIIGDDGVKNIKIGSDYPGNQFLAFQNFIKTLMDRGIIITLCSKNNEETALAAFKKRTDMVLNLDDVITHRINWNAKSQNIKEIALELGLGLQNFLLIDDNPMERMEVRYNAPEVMVPEMPEDVSLWPLFLSQIPALTSLKILKSDKKRLEKYKIRNKIGILQKASPDKKTFLKNLEMKLQMSNLSTDTFERTLQLIKRTNQYNTTGIRLNEHELNSFVEANNDVITVKISDRFGSDDIVAVVMISYSKEIAEIDNYVMSCRVLGRGVETAVLAEVCSRAKDRGCVELFGKVLKTTKNQPCQDVYKNHNFKETANGIFKLHLNKPIKFPDWFSY